MNFLDLFAGIGGFRLGMERAGHECIGYVEIDKFARKSYEAIFDTEGEWTAHDITSVTDGDLRFLRGKGIDVICGGFPCQAFSVAGKRGGFSDTRGTLFFEIARFAKEIKPRFLFLENVKGLLSHEKGRTFGIILNTLDELGYDCEWQIINSKNHGVPQNRERTFIIGHLRGTGGREVFPIRGENRKVIKTIGYINPDGYRQTNEVLSSEGISTTLRTFQGGGLQPKILAGKIMKPKHIPGPDDVNNTLRTGGKGSLTAKHNYEHIHDGYRIRKLTPRECWRLQGFPDWAFDKAQAVNSDSQLYKQAGNSVTVNVIYEIAKRF